MQLTQCPDCPSSVRVDRIETHVRKIHGRQLSHSELKDLNAVTNGTPHKAFEYSAEVRGLRTTSDVMAFVGLISLVVGVPIGAMSRNVQLFICLGSVGILASWASNIFSNLSLKKMTPAESEYFNSTLPEIDPEEEAEREWRRHQREMLRLQRDTQSSESSSNSDDWSPSFTKPYEG